MSAPEEIPLESRLETMERLLQELAGAATGLTSGAALTLEQAMDWFAYKDRDTFMKAVRRDGIPYVRQNAKRILFNRVDLTRWKSARTVHPVKSGRLVA